MKRRQIRTPVNVKAELVSGLGNYKGSIMDLSDDGLYLVTEPTKASTDFIPGNSVNVKFQTHSGKNLTLNCEVAWLHIHKTPPYGLTNEMGVGIIDTPQEYREFFIFKAVE